MNHAQATTFCKRVLRWGKRTTRMLKLLNPKTVARNWVTAYTELALIESVHNGTQGITATTLADYIGYTYDSARITANQFKRLMDIDDDHQNQA